MSSNEDFSILIMDDKVSDLNVLTKILEPAYSVRAKSPVAEGGELVGEDKPDIILLDADVAGADSFETLFALKERGETRDIPVIMIADRANNENEARWLFLGAVDHIAKPFVSSIVMSKIKNQIQVIRQIRTIRAIGQIDPLTALPDRTAFEKQLEIEWKRGIAEQTALSVVTIDIDAFKGFNELYGYPQGNAVLQQTADVIKSTLKRKSDFLARLGNDEFGLILPNTDQEGVLLVSENICQNIENMTIPTIDYTARTRITVSIGTAATFPVFDQKPLELLTAANAARMTA